MFAIALWDARTQKLVLARDRMGKKPLYYALGSANSWSNALALADSPPLPSTRLIFGSEPKALLCHGDLPRALDEEALVQYLALEYVPTPFSIYRSIRKLPAAHLAVLDEKGFRIRRYWDLPAPSQDPLPHEPETELLQFHTHSSAPLLIPHAPHNALSSAH